MSPKTEIPENLILQAITSAKGGREIEDIIDFIDYVDKSRYTTTEMLSFLKILGKRGIVIRKNDRRYVKS